MLLSVLAPAAKETLIADLLLRETTTLGVRMHYVHRHEARRTFAAVATAYGKVQVKLKWVDDEITGCKPEYEDCQRLANEHTTSVRQVYEAAQASAYQAFITLHSTVKNNKEKQDD